MKLSQLRQIARSQGFNFKRVSRIHSSLYRLASDMPETKSAVYFDSMHSLLAFVSLPTERVAVLSAGTTCQYSFYSFKRFDVLSVHK